MSVNTAMVTGPLRVGSFVNATPSSRKTLELGLHVCHLERGQRDPLIKHSLLKGLGCRVRVWFQRELEIVGAFGRDHGDPPDDGRSRICSCATNGGSRGDPPVGSGAWLAFSSCAYRRRSRPIPRRNSAPWTLNWSCASRSRTRSPRRLRRRPPRRLALLARARPLPITHPHVRREPRQALPTWALIGRHGGHRRLPPGSFSPRPTSAPR